MQTTLADALAATAAPDSAEDLERWIRGIARHKIADLYRGRRHESPGREDGAEIAVDDRAPHSARDLLRWATKALPDAKSDQHTLEWMLREGAGEKLEEIAQEQGIPAARVRQRVSRLRRLLRERWAAQVAAVAGIALVVGVAYLLLRDAPDVPPVARELPATPKPAELLRKRALAACERQAFEDCLALLDQAKQLDPAGESLAEIRRARAAASNALLSQPAPRDIAPPVPTTAPPAPTTAPPLTTDSPPVRVPAPVDSAIPRTQPEKVETAPRRTPKDSVLPTQTSKEVYAPTPETPAKWRETSEGDDVKAKAPRRNVTPAPDSTSDDKAEQAPKKRAPVRQSQDSLSDS